MHEQVILVRSMRDYLNSLYINIK